MEWRKKKQRKEVTERSESAHGPVAEGQGGAAGSVGSSGTTAIGTAGNAALLTPQNLDYESTGWAAGAREFALSTCHSESQRPYVVPRNYLISGNISTQRRVVISGEVIAQELRAPTITVASGGVVRGTVHAGSVQVAGTIDARVVATQSVEVSGRGHVSGVVRSPAVKVWPGAVLHTASMEVGAE